MMDDNFENLANAIVLQAVKDYREAIKKLKKNPESKEAEGAKIGVELFFRSTWYELLTDVDPEMLLERLQGEAL